MIKEYIIKIDKDQSKKDIYGGYTLNDPPLELIRCKDCVKRPDEHKTELNGKSYRYCELHRRWTTDDWFCADGERKVTMPDIEKVIKAWEIFRDSNPYEICDGREFRAIVEPEYCMGQMIADTINLLKEQEAKIRSLEQTIEDICCGGSR